MQCIFYMLKQCVTSINALKSDIKSLAAYGHLIEEVKSLVRNFSDFFFFFFFLFQRQDNSAVHNIARHVSEFLV